MIDELFPKDLKDNYSEKYNSTYYAKVTQIGDPLGLDRVRVRVFGIHTEDLSLLLDEDCPWAEVSSPYKMSINPTVGDWVYIIFINGDPMRPLVFGEAKVIVAGSVGGGEGGPAATGESYIQSGSLLSASEMGQMITNGGGDAAIASVDATLLTGTTLDNETLQQLAGGEGVSQIVGWEGLRGCVPELVTGAQLLHNYMKSKGYRGITISNAYRGPNTTIGRGKQGSTAQLWLNFKAGKVNLPKGWYKTTLHPLGMAMDINPVNKGGQIINTAAVIRAGNSRTSFGSYITAADFWKKLGVGYRWGGPTTYGGDFQYTMDGKPPWLSDPVHFDLGLKFEQQAIERIRAANLNKSGTVAYSPGKLLGTQIAGWTNPKYDQYGGTNPETQLQKEMVKMVTGEDINASDIHRGAMKTKFSNIVLNPANMDVIDLGKTFEISSNIEKPGSFGTTVKIPVSAAASGTGFNTSYKEGKTKDLQNRFVPVGMPDTSLCKLVQGVGQTIFGRSRDKANNIFLHATGGYRREPELEYNAKYPLAWNIDTDGGTYIHISDNPKGETFTVGHKALSYMQIKSSGAILLNSAQNSIDITSKNGLYLQSVENIDISTNQSVGIVGETNYVCLSGITRTQSKENLLHMNGSSGYMVNVVKTMGGNRMIFSMDHKNEEMIMSLYAPTGEDDGEHMGLLNPFAYIKLAKSGITIAHPTKVEIKSSTLKIPPYSKPNPWNPAPDMGNIQKLANKVEPLLVNEKYMDKVND